MVSETILSDVQGHVATLTLNRPDRRNALTMEMRSRLTELLAEYEADGQVRVVVLTGAPPSFCAGVDLGDVTSGQGHDLATAPPSVSAPFAAFSKPLIASVDGAAAGGGFEIALACDFIVASSRAKFLLPEVKIGSLPGGGGTQRLPRAIPRAVAARLLLTGESIDAQQAQDYGLVSDVVDPDDLAGFTGDLAGRIAANAPLSLLALKKCLRAASNTSLDEGLLIERGLWAQLSTTEDRAEGRAAFREKRAPLFKGR